MIHQAIIAGYLDKEIENYGLLKVTKAGHSFLKNPKSFKIVEDKEFNEDDEDVTINRAEFAPSTQNCTPSLKIFAKRLPRSWSCRRM